MSQIAQSILKRNPSPLSNAFFSQENINTIQILLKSSINTATNGKYSIENQSEGELVQVMIKNFEGYPGNQITNIPQQLVGLNNNIVNQTLPNILTNINQYLGYLEFASQDFNPIDRPVDTNIKGENPLFNNQIGV